MACVTLKRPHTHTLDPFMAPAAESRESVATTHSQHRLGPPMSKRRRCTQLTFVPAPPSSNSGSADNTAASCMRHVAEAFPRLSGEDLRQRLRQEVRRLRRARLLPPHSSGCSTAPVPLLSVPSKSDGTLLATTTGSSSSSDSEESSSPVRPSSCSQSSERLTATSHSPVSAAAAASSLRGRTAASSSSSSMSAPLFSFHQIGLICARLLAEREEQLRSEYERVLSDKLAEQYEAFLRFSHEQLYRSHQDMPMSYVS